MKNRIIVMIMAAVFALPAMAGWINQERKDATVQQETFQSTSTMAPSGSAYSSNPTLDIDGTASTPTSTPSKGPRRSKMDDDPDFGEHTDVGGNGTDNENWDYENSPIGDAVLPLLLFAGAAAGIIALRRRRALSR